MTGPVHGESNAVADEELVRRFQAAEDREGAFLALFERYGALTYAFLRRRIGNADLAAEQNQDLFLAVLESLERFRGESSFRTWLFRLAQYRLSNLRRRLRVHLDELPQTTPDQLVDALRGPEGQRPDAQMFRGETSDSLMQCLAALSDVQRAVVIGQYYENVTLEQLTRRLRLTNKSGARASLIAAQRKLRRCLERVGVTREG